MRVALIGPLPPSLGGATPGGVATHQAYLAAGLAHCRGVEISLLGSNVRADSADAWCLPSVERPYPLLRMYQPKSVAEMRNPGYLRRAGALRTLRYARAVRTMKFGGSRRELLANLLWYAYFLRCVRPDIIHVQHPLERHRYLRIVKHLERLRTPVVVTAHSFFGEHPGSMIQEFMAPNLRSADAVIAVSPHIADQAEQLGVHHSRIRVIRSGVDTQRFSPRDRDAAREALGVGSGTKLVLFVGNLEPRKQVDVLLRALPEQASLVVIGTGENAGCEDQTEGLRELTAALALQGRVRFLGRVADSALLEWYAATDVFALPSSSEAQGISALEAMACGLPVVASAVGGLLRTIDHGRTGYLVPSGDVDALRVALQMVLEDPARAQEVGRAARSAVMERFAWTSAVEQTVSVYHQVLGG